MRPTPLCFTPPQGAVGSPKLETQSLIVTTPAASSRWSRRAVSRLAGPAAGGEAVLAVVGEADRLVERVDRHHRQDRAERLLAHDPHGVVDPASTVGG